MRNRTPKKGRRQGEKRGTADGSAVPQNLGCVFLLCFSIVQEAERGLKLNFKPKFQSGWNGSPEKWGTGGGQNRKSGELNEKRAYDFTRKPLDSHGRDG